MRHSALLALSWACHVALTSACNAPAQAPVRSRDAAASAHVDTPDASPRRDARTAQRPLHAKPRVKAFSAGLAGLREGAELPDQTIVLARGEDLLLDFAAGARVHLRGPCLAQSAVTELDALLVRRCALSVDLAPAAATPDSGFSLTTPSAALSLVRGGRLAVRVFENGATSALIVSGSASVQAAGSGFVPVQDALASGQRIDVAPDGKLVRVAVQASTLAQAEQRAIALPETKPDPRVPAERDQLLVTCSRELRGELARAEELTRAHRALLAAEGATDGGDEPRMALQAELASHAAVLARARLRLALALGQRDASRLSAGQVTDDALSAEARGLLRP